MYNLIIQLLRIITYETKRELYMIHIHMSAVLNDKFSRIEPSN